VAVSYTNNWKNISDKLKNILSREFGKILPVYVGESDYTDNQFLKIIPISNEIIEKYAKGELREYSFQINYNLRDSNIGQNVISNMLRILSRIESVLGNNRTYSLADSSTIIHGRLINYDILDSEDELQYIVELDYKCVHLGNNV
tara:strand:- start:397 stop:831 length:435 start_codon:yes stop_codon:yes gene_type:complete